MSKRLMRMMYLILAAVMLLVNCAFAQTEQTETQQSTAEFVSSVTAEAVADETDGYGLTDAELLEGYLYRCSGLSSDSMALAAVEMSDDMETLYNALVLRVQAVAKGEETSTEFQLGILFTWTATNLGCGSSLSEVQTAAKERLNKISPDELLQRLLSGMPYDLYWFDKTQGFTLGRKEEYGYDEGAREYTVKVTYTVAMPVSQDYAPDNAAAGYNTDKAKIKEVQSTVTRAQSVVDTYSDKSDYEKLVAYLEWITGAVSYNSGVAAGTAYGDPWQIVYVFDGNPDTNVVCEGYAKAFKYLCDLTWAESGSVRCYLATGEISGDNVKGGHMWNIVSIGEKNYLADITNCDTGMGGCPDKLFLCGVSGSMSGGYTACDVTYKYDDYITTVYDEAELTLSKTAYTPPSGYQLGDVNRDGSITAADMQRLYLHLNGTNLLEDTSTADVNKDGQITAADMQRLYTHLNGTNPLKY